MPRPALNFYVKFTPGNFKGPASARRARAIFRSASFALQNFISAFKFYLRDLTLLFKFTSQKSASVFKFSRRRFALNLRAILRAVFAAAEALSAKILSCKIPVPRSFARQSLGQQGCAQQSALARRNLTPKKSARRNRASKIAAPQNFMRLNLAVPRYLSPLNSAFKFKASADV